VLKTILSLRALVALAAVFALSDFAMHAAGTGLTGKYFTNTTFSGTAVLRTDTNLNFTWPGPPIAGVDSNNFSVAWAGQIEPEFTELYTFYLTADDAARLWVDDECIVQRTFYQGNGELRGQMRLKAGHRVNLRIEFIEFTGNAGIKLEWASPSRAREVVPMARLYPAAEIPNGGSVMREVWHGLVGASISTITTNVNYPNKPASREFLTSFECLATNWDDSFGTRVTGFLRAPASGNYMFAVSGDDVVQLYLSTSTNAAAKVLIASVTNMTGFREWANQPGQISAPIALTAGQRCYVELLHKEDTGADHWSVGWMPPGDTNFSVIPGSVLMMPGTDRATPSTSSYFNTLATEQPRLGATRERFTWLKQQYLSPNASNAKSRAQAIISMANSDVANSTRHYGNEIPRLALAWWLTGDPVYAEKVWTHTQDTMTNGDFTVKWKGYTLRQLAYAYDWLYPYWDSTRRTNLLNFIVTSGFNSQGNSYGNNIGILNDSGFIMAALAVGTGNEGAAEPDLSQAVSQLAQKIDQWEPNAGAWLEGTDYGIFAKLGLADAMQSIETALGSSFGLGRVPGFFTARREPLTIMSNTRQRFTFSDVGTGSNVPMGWGNWWARRYDALEVFDFSRQSGNSTWNALLLPETTSSPASVGLNPDTCFQGPAEAVEKSLMQHVATLRQNWTDSKATFVGGMGGTYMSHGMLQSGTFQLSARGVNWFVDLKSESYDVPNHNGTTPVAGADRWDYYRNRAEGHNCLIVNPTSQPDRIWNAVAAPMLNFQSTQNGQRSFAVWDLSANITGVTKVQRGIQLLGNRKQVLVQDEIVTPGASTAWWFAHFPNSSITATISGDGISVTLQNGTERLWSKIVSGDGVWTVRAARPLPTSPNPAEAYTNSTYSKLAIQLTGVTNTTLAVWFVPLAPGENPPTNSLTLTPLNTWNLVAQNEPPVAKNGVATSTNNQPVDIELRSLATDDWTYPNYMTFAVSNAQGGSVALLPDGHTARFTPLTNYTGDVSFAFTATEEGALTSVPATITIGVSPVTYVWTNTIGGNWSTGANWSNGVAPLSSHGTRVEFFTGAALSNLTLTTTNDVASTLLLNSLALGGTGTNANIITLAGAPLSLVANGLTQPAITLAAFTGPVSYLVSSALTLAADTTFYANNSGTFNFAGPINGPGGITRSNTYSTLILSENNSYAGPTVIAGGTLQIGNDGPTGTLGSGPVTIASGATLRFDRTGLVLIPNDITGAGRVIVNGATSSDVVSLTGDNDFTGEVRVDAGSLRVTDIRQLGSGTKNVIVASSSALLRLNGSSAPLVFPPDFSLHTSNPNGAILNEAGDNEILGSLTLSSGAGGTRLTVAAGSLTIGGIVTPNATGRALDLRGAGSGIINGNLVDGAGANVLTGFSKNDAGTWTFNGNNAITCTTVISAGKLVINGSHVSSNVIVSSGATLAGRGTIAAPTAVLGKLLPGDAFGTMTYASNLTFGSASRLQWELGSNSPAGDLVLAAAVTITNGAKVDVLLNSPGSTVNFLHALWRTNRSWPVLNASALTGTFALGTNTTDAGGRPVATYGSFSLTNTTTNVSLLWTALPGFVVINDPTVAITLPATNPLTLPMGVFSLKITASVNNNGGSNLTTLWTQVSGPVDGGTAAFASTTATNTTVQFSDPGDYRLRFTVSNEVGRGSADLVVTVVQNPVWHQTLITFTNYPGTEPLTNFPALITLGTNVPGFSHADFLTPDGSDLRILSADGSAELNFEIDEWHPGGLSRVWVQVPVFTNHAAILARWGDPKAVDAPAYTTDGSTWSNGFIGVWHLRETSGEHLDSSPNLATTRGVIATAQGTAAGIVGGADDFDGVNDFVSLPDMGTNARVTVECWVFLNATPGAGDIGLVSSDPWSPGVVHFKTSSTLQLKAQINSAGTVNSANNLVPVSNWFHAAYTIASNGATDFKTWFNATLVGSSTGATNNILTDVSLAREYSGRYLNARLDEVRISSVARSSNWLWATHRNIASNATFARYDAVFSPTNHPPALVTVSNRILGIGQWLLVTNSATDADAPPQSLTFSLVNPPANATVGADTGVLTWRVPVALGGTTNPITVLATDNGSPGLVVTQSFLVTVLPLTNPPVGTAPRLSNGQWQFTLNGPVGPDYTVQASTNLASWTNLLVTNSPTLPFNWTDTNTGSFLKRFYRVLLNP
jgi:autotransporter-associated beta strand protein